MPAPFRWLHISDLHVGMSNAGWMWPSLKSAFRDDLARQVMRVGTPDLLVFSGDMVQSGSEIEYDRCTDILLEIASWIGISPNKLSVIATPGNHDLVRPPEDSADAIALSLWFSQEQVRKEFFSRETKFRRFANSLFDNYKGWTDRLSANGFLIPQHKEGILRGDAAYEIETSQGIVGLITLNSTWLQFTAGDMKGALHVAPDQLMGVTDYDPDKWCSRHFLNLLITHHPSDWLSESSQVSWVSEINLAGRFDLHLYGHMHEAKSIATSLGGAPVTRSLQSASLFGLEKARDGTLKREHGYNIAEVSASDHGLHIRIWPRKAQQSQAGRFRFSPDTSFELDDDISFSLGSASHLNVPGTSAVASQLPALSVDSAVAFFKEHDDRTAPQGLDRIQYRLPIERRQERVRAVEQDLFGSALANEKLCWIVSEWGMGEDGFLGAALQKLNKQNSAVYRLLLTDLNELNDLQQVTKSRTGKDLSGLAEELSSKGTAVLLLDDIPPDDEAEEGDRLHPIERSARIMLDFAPGFFVILRTRRPPKVTPSAKIELKPLDESDLKLYLEDSGSVALSKVSEKTLGLIYRKTEGVPSRVDSLLRDLEVASIQETVSPRPATQQRNEPTAGPTASQQALAKAVAELADAPEDVLRRSYDLLKLLSLIPYGEQLSRIRRLHNSKAFFNDHAQELLKRALIESSLTYSDALSVDEGSAPRLSVPRVVRDYVAERIGANETRALTRRLALLYFGPDWSSGILKVGSNFRYDRPDRSEAEIKNASALLLRLYLDADRGSRRSLEGIASLASGFVAALIRGAHYRDVILFCEDLFLAAEVQEVSVDADPFMIIRSRLGRAVRMTGDADRAVSILDALSGSPLSHDEKISALLSLSLAYQTNKANADALRVSQEVCKLDRKGAYGLQARTTIVELSEHGPVRTLKLKELRLESVRKKVWTNANNISLLLAAESSGRDAIDLAAEALSLGSKETDHFNTLRALIMLISLRRQAGEIISLKEKTQVVSAYRYILSERMTPLFEKSHSLLWDLLEDDQDDQNLLALFRQSSFYWRIRGEEDRERRYMARLAKKATNAISVVGARPGRALQYFVARLASVPGSS